MTPDPAPEILVSEAGSLDRQGRVVEAIKAYELILARWPALPNCWYNLALLQRKARRFAQSLASYQQALARGIREPEQVHLNRSIIYCDYLHQYEAAERELLTALELNSVYVPALLNLANLHEDLGRRPAALQGYERILALQPGNLQALARYANLKTFADPGDGLIAELRSAIARPSVSSADRASLGFALGRALDACGDYPAAFAAYETANRESRNSAEPGAARYDRAREERFIDRLIATFPRRESAAVNVTRPRPIFVCGMFRSGSTLVEQLLAAHPRVDAGGELDFLPYIAQRMLAPFPETIPSIPAERLKEIAAHYLDALAQLFPAAQSVTDKRPDNFLYIGLIKALFAGAKIVHTLRDPLDNCLSIFFLHLDHRMSYAFDLMDIGHQYRQYQRLMAHWKAAFPGDIFDLSYDALVREPKRVMEQLLGFLDLEWNEQCLAVPVAGRPIKTASVWQVREPLYRRSSGRARHYQRELDALRQYLSGDAPR